MTCCEPREAFCACASGRLRGQGGFWVLRIDEKASPLVPHLSPCGPSSTGAYCMLCARYAQSLYRTIPKVGSPTLLSSTAPRVHSRDHCQSRNARHRVFWQGQQPHLRVFAQKIRATEYVKGVSVPYSAGLLHHFIAKTYLGPPFLKPAWISIVETGLDLQWLGGCLAQDRGFGGWGWGETWGCGV